ncbi:MAG: hypothetical protein KDB27_34365 [Planctomycetales bacterium]|nr:hypothetical protein [Planctomycetales bacterium]
MARKRVLRTFLAALMMLPGTVASADSTTAEFRHITTDGSGNFTYYGCQTCTLPFGPLPPTPGYGGAAAPATTTFTSTTAIANSPFELGGQAGLSVSVDDTNLQTGDQFWFSSEMHVETLTDFTDTAVVQGVPNGTTGTVLFNWVLSGDHTMTLDATNPVGVSTVNVSRALTSAVLSIDTTPLGIPSIPPWVSSNIFADGLPGVDITDDAVTQNPPAVSDVIFFPVPFTAGDILNLKFDLALYTDLAVKNIDSPLFSGQLDASFANTATLESVQVFDANEQLIEEASLLSLETGNFYPSPNDPPPPNPVLDVLVDVLPDGVNNDEHGVIPVAIFGSADFDVTQIDLATVELDTLKIKVKSNNTFQASLDDLNNDSFADYVVKIDDSAIVYDPNDTVGTVTGMLFGGQLFQGTDAITIVGVNSVPEPSSFTIVLALCGLAFARSRRHA